MNPFFENKSVRQQHIISLFFATACMAAATVIGFLYVQAVPENNANVALVFILALVVVSRYTRGYWYGIASCLFAVVCVNFVFTYPYFEFNFTLTGYPVTFLGMATITIITSTLTSHVTAQAEILAEREKLLAEAEKEKMRANLLRAISHDLRTPLTGIMGNSSVLLDDRQRLTEEEQREILSNIYSDSNWLLNMVENLLTVTRIKGDDMKINTMEEPVEEVVAEALQRLRKRYPDTEIDVKIPTELILIPMDAILIEQVTINLLENAVIHSGTTEPIQLIVENYQDHVSFTVRDFGKGLPEAMLDNLFDSTTYTKSEVSDARRGMGIGLSICKTIITAHHGTLIGRNHGDGAEFIFTIPKSVTQSRNAS